MCVGAFYHVLVLEAQALFKVVNETSMRRSTMSGFLLTI